MLLIQCISYPIVFSYNHNINNPITNIDVTQQDTYEIWNLESSLCYKHIWKQGNKHASERTLHDTLQTKEESSVIDSTKKQHKPQREKKCAKALEAASFLSLFSLQFGLLSFSPYSVNYFTPSQNNCDTITHSITFSPQCNLFDLWVLTLF